MRIHSMHYMSNMRDMMHFMSSVRNTMHSSGTSITLLVLLACHCCVKCIWYLLSSWTVTSSNAQHRQYMQRLCAARQLRRCNRVVYSICKLHAHKTILRASRVYDIPQLTALYSGVLNWMRALHAEWTNHTGARMLHLCEEHQLYSIDRVVCTHAYANTASARYHTCHSVLAHCCHYSEF
jgi:hypothetical protein